MDWQANVGRQTSAAHQDGGILHSGHRAHRPGAPIRHHWHHLDRDRAVRPHYESGIGRDGSKYGIEEFFEVKYLCMGGIDR
jgi:hypothetical protein